MLELIGDLKELPEIIVDNAKCGCKNEHYGNGMSVMTTSMTMDVSAHSTTSQSSRWDSMPAGKTTMNSRSTYPSRGTTPNKCSNSSFIMKQPRRTDSFCGSEGPFPLKDSLIRPRRCLSPPPPSSQTQPLGTSSPLGTPRASCVHDILDQAMGELQMT
jgi:hypothetical protein